MASSKKSTSWQNIRRTLASKSQRELLNLIRDLYNLQPEVRDFIIDKFLPRLKATVQEAEDIGWGYGDAVYDTLEEVFPEG